MRIEAGRLTRIAARIFEAAGSAPDEAGCVGRHLVDSNLCGHDSHGVLRVPRYVDFVRKGEIRPGAVPEIVLERDALLVLDGRMGFGQVAGERAMALLAPKAKRAGVALCGLRNSGHVGRLGDWAEQLARDGLVSLHFLNTTGRGMLAVPFGGSDRRLSLNPLAICAPVPGRPPILLDMTTTVVAEGKVAVARNKGVPLAPGAIVDKHGDPSTNPNDLYDGGALLPIAGHKGSGLNVMVDILAGALSGGGCTAPGVTVLVNTMTSIAIDPALVGDAAAIGAEIARYGDWVKGSPPKDPGGSVLLPGEIEHATREERGRDGIPLDAETWRQLLAAGEAVGLNGAELEKLAA